MYFFFSQEISFYKESISVPCQNCEWMHRHKSKYANQKPHPWQEKKRHIIYKKKYQTIYITTLYK